MFTGRSLTRPMLPLSLKNQIESELATDEPSLDPMLRLSVCASLMTSLPKPKASFKYRENQQLIAY